MKKKKQKKIERRMKRVQKVIDGKLDIDDLGIKELKLMYEIVQQIAEDRIFDEMEKPDKLH